MWSADNPLTPTHGCGQEIILRLLCALCIHTAYIANIL